MAEISVNMVCIRKFVLLTVGGMAEATCLESDQEFDQLMYFKNIALVSQNKGKRILTTAQLADSYETDSNTITVNLTATKMLFIGKHYFCLEGNALKEFKNDLENF